MNTETSNDTSTIEAEVRDTVEQGNNVQEKVRQLKKLNAKLTRLIRV